MKKLKLSRETLSVLNASDLSQVQGGNGGIIIAPSAACPIVSIGGCAPVTGGPCVMTGGGTVGSCTSECGGLTTTIGNTGTSIINPG